MRKKRHQNSDGEFLWLISLSDLMILLFVFFVVLFSFSFKKLSTQDFQEIRDRLSGKETVAKEGSLDQIQAHLLKWVVDKNLLQSVEMERKQYALIIRIREKLLFKSASFVLMEESQELIDYLSQALSKIPKPYRIGIEGHTDDNPIQKGSKVEDNWELSVQRALNVFRALHLPQSTQERTVILGYGPKRPLVPNRDAHGKAIVENQNKNRRVTIRVF